MNNSIKRTQVTHVQFFDSVECVKNLLALHPNGLRVVSVQQHLKAQLGIDVAESTVLAICGKANFPLIRKKANRSQGHATDNVRFIAGLLLDLQRGATTGWSDQEIQRLSNIRRGAKTN